MPATDRPRRTRADRAASALAAVAAATLMLAGGALWRVMGEVTRTTAMIYMLIFGA